MFSLSNRVAIVTGASSGLGARFASVLAGAGANVVASARRLGRLEELGETEPMIHPVQADVTVEEDRQRLVATTLERFGRVDVLVNNAGMGSGGPEQQSSLDVFRSVLRAQPRGCFRAFAGGRGADARAGLRVDHQHRFHVRSRRIGAGTGRRIRCVEERGQRPHPRARERSGERMVSVSTRSLRAGFCTEMTTELFEDEKTAALARRASSRSDDRARSRSSTACSCFSRPMPPRTARDR